MSAITLEITGPKGTKRACSVVMYLRSWSLFRLIAGLHVTSRCHGVTSRHVGGQEQKHFSPLGTKLYFHVNSPRKNSIVLTSNMAALSRGCKNQE